MAEYIDREKLLDDLLAAAKHGGMGEIIAQTLMRYVKRQPAADVAEVVRCKDCKHYRNHPNGLCYLHTEPKENARGHSGNAVCVEPDDFCSYGERKEDAT